VVTGASSGIGRRTALDLAAAGATVCGVARREPELRALVDEMAGAERGHSYFVADVSERADVRALADHVSTVHGRCDVLVNNAGFSRGGAFEGADDVGDVEAMMATNFFGTVYCTAELMPLLLAAAPSSVVNVASVAGRFGLAGSSGYCASKFAVVGWSEGIHFELAEKGINVSLVLPGPIPTEGFPQTALVGDSVMKHALGSDADVSAAIMDAVARSKMERVVPRWYYALQFPKLLVPPLYRYLQQKVIARVPR
jgi:short-subunit dehydrogenase